MAVASTRVVWVWGGVSGRVTGFTLDMAMKHGWHPLGFEWARGRGKNKQRKKVLRSIASWGLFANTSLV